MQYLLLLTLLIFSCAPTEPEEIVIITTLSECDGPPNLDCGDYTFLKEFSDLNAQPFRHHFDISGACMCDGEYFEDCTYPSNYSGFREFCFSTTRDTSTTVPNGQIEPLEFGYQVWDDGRLIQLDLNYNPLAIMQQDDPTQLDATDYRLTDMPDNIGDLDALETLWLHDNYFSSVPASIGNLKKLKILDLENNGIVVIPDEIGGLTNLEFLVLNYNNIESLPESVVNLSSLERLFIHHNKLTALPEDIGGLSKLEWLYVQNNNLLSLPELSNLENLKKLNIENNFLGSLPTSICDIYPGEWQCEEDSEGNCIGEATCITSPKCLETFSIGNNKLCEDGIPSCVVQNPGNQSCADCDPWEFNIEGYCADSTDYQILQNFLDLNVEAQSIVYPPSDTILTTFPDSASDCINTGWWDDGRLIEITFEQKGLTSIIPANFGNLDQLEVLQLTGNQLTGEIPDELMNLNSLRILKLNRNNLMGELPTNIAGLQDLESLWLNYNNFTGEIPQGITQLDKLQHLRLDHNDLTGSIPQDIVSLSNMLWLRLDNNNLTGEIPSNIGDLVGLRQIYLLNNDLSGQIPASICNIEELTSYYFNNNKLCPEYPVCLPCPDDDGDGFCSPESRIGIQDMEGCIDCNGVLSGSAYEDECGTCDDDSTNDCVQDCAGVWGGSGAYLSNGTTCCASGNIDCNDVCDGPSLSNLNGDCCLSGLLDCNDECDGNALLDDCGECDNDPSNDCVCVDDVTGAWVDIGGHVCNAVINGMGQACDASFMGISIWEECPVSCDACPPAEDGCDMPSNSFGITDDGWVLYNSAQIMGGFEFYVEGTTFVDAMNCQSDGASSCGDAANYGDAGNVANFDLQTAPLTSKVLGFSTAGATVPAGCGSLLKLKISSGTPIGITGIIVADANANALNFTHYCMASTCFDCNDGCTCGIDCAGNCGGSAIVDECGVCGGDGSSCSSEGE